MTDSFIILFVLQIIISHLISIGSRKKTAFRTRCQPYVVRSFNWEICYESSDFFHLAGICIRAIDIADLGTVGGAKIDCVNGRHAVLSLTVFIQG